MHHVTSVLGRAFLTGLALSFGWTLVEMGVLLLWPGFEMIRILVGILAYAVLPMIPAGQVKALFPRGISVTAVVIASVMIVFALALGRTLLLFLLTGVLGGSLPTYLEYAAFHELLLLAVAFFFALKSYQVGPEYSPRNEIIERYGNRFNF